MSKRRPRGNSAESAMVRALDTLADYDQYTTEVLPVLRKAIAEGWEASKIEAHPLVKAALVARKLSIALSDKNPAVALTAIKDTLDRIEGKAVERKDIKLNLESASDEELDARLKSLMVDEAETASDDETAH